MSDMKLVGNWNYPTSIRFGAGRIAELGEAAKAAGMSRPLLVTDPRLAEMPMVKDALGAAGRRRRAGRCLLATSSRTRSPPTSRLGWRR